MLVNKIFYFFYNLSFLETTKIVKTLINNFMSTMFEDTKGQWEAVNKRMDNIVWSKEKWQNTTQKRQRLSNANFTKYRGWTLVLRTSKQFLLLDEYRKLLTKVQLIINLVFLYVPLFIIFIALTKKYYRYIAMV
jgi:hypothetical protein